jgi:hypothetical protein
MSVPKQFFYCRVDNGAPVPGLSSSEQTQRWFPQLNTTIDSLTAEELVPLGLIRVVRNAYPMDGYNYTEGLPELQDDVWVAPWVQQPTPDREKRLFERSRQVRNDRNSGLSQCDWTQMPDTQLSAEQKSAWGAYRQALRDVPAQSNFPWEVVWPAKP